MRPAAADTQGDFSLDHERQVKAVPVMDWIWGRASIIKKILV